jgi:hypothetical protein
MEKAEEKLEECIKEWQAEGSTVEFIEFAREVFLPYMLRVHKNRAEGRSAGVTCDSVVKLVSLMICDLGGGMVGVHDRKELVVFYNKFLFELATDLNEVTNYHFGSDGELQPVQIIQNPTKH